MRCSKLRARWLRLLWMLATIGWCIEGVGQPHVTGDFGARGAVNTGGAPRFDDDDPDGAPSERAINDLLQRWRRAAAEPQPQSHQIADYYQQLSREPQCAADRRAFPCAKALLQGPAVVRDLNSAPSWAPEFTPDQHALAKVADRATGLAEAALNGVATGLGIPAVSGVVEDFQALAVDSLLNLETLEEPQTLGVRVPLPRLFWLQPRLTTYATPLPELNPLLEKRLVEDGRAQLLSDSEDDLSPGDDYFYALDVSLLGPWFGRELSDNHRVRQNLLSSVTQSENSQLMLAAVKRLKLRDERDRKALAYAVADLADFEQRVWHRISGAGLNDFWKLIHNQPQLDLQVKRLKRDDLVGAEASSWRVSFSTGLANLTWLRLFGDCNAELNNVACPGVYREWINSWVLRHGVGLSAYYEQGDIADLSVQLPPLAAGAVGLVLQDLLPGEALGLGIDPDDPNRFVIDGGRYQRFGIGLGATLTDPKPALATSTSLRLDLGADYYRYDRSPVRLDHEVMRMTLTWRRGAISIPLNLMYRSESEFEANLDDKVAVGLGVSYRH